MSDVLPSIEPEDSGRVTKLDVPVSRYLSSAFALGQSDSMYSAVANTTEDQIDKSYQGGKMLEPDEANKQYGVGDLKFTQPVNSTMAATMSERERTKMDAEMWLTSGATKARFLPGMAAGVLGATANPLDFGSMFVPFVGQEGKIATLGKLSNTLRRGLITQEVITRTGIPVPKLIGSMAQAGMWQGMAEIPKVVQSINESQPLPNIGADELGQLAFAGILHGVGEGLKLMRPETHDAMTKQAVNDFVNDKTTSVHQYIPMDEHVIQYQAMEHDRQLREEAANNVDIDKIKRDVVSEKGEYPIDAAIRNKDTGEVRTGPAHPLIDVEDWGGPNDGNFGEAKPEYKGVDEGFVTDKGRFVSRDEADKLTGSGGDFLTSEALHSPSDPDWLAHNERTKFDDLKEQYHYTDAQAMNVIRDDRVKRREQRILANPDVQKEIESRRQQAIKDWVDKKKQEIANPVPKEVRQTATTPIVPRDQVEKYNGDAEHLNKSLDEDIEGLTGEKDAHNQNVDEHVENLAKIIGKPGAEETGHDQHKSNLTFAKTTINFFKKALESRGTVKKAIHDTIDFLREHYGEFAPNKISHGEQLATMRDAIQEGGTMAEGEDWKNGGAAVHLTHELTHEKREMILAAGGKSGVIDDAGKFMTYDEAHEQYGTAPTIKDEDKIVAALEKIVSPDPHEPNPDHAAYQKLVTSMKTADDKFKVAGEIEKLKNKYGGMVPPEKIVSPELNSVPNAIDAAVECILRKLL